MATIGGEYFPERLDRRWRALGEPGGGCLVCGFPRRGHSGTCPECGDVRPDVDRRTLLASLDAWSAVDNVLATFGVVAAVPVTVLAAVGLIDLWRGGWSDRAGVRRAFRGVAFAAMLATLFSALPLVALVPHARQQLRVPLR